MPGSEGPNVVNYNIAIGACARARCKRRSGCFYVAIILFAIVCCCTNVLSISRTRRHDVQSELLTDLRILNSYYITVLIVHAVDG